MASLNCDNGGKCLEAGVEQRQTIGGEQSVKFGDAFPALIRYLQPIGCVEQRWRSVLIVEKRGCDLETEAEDERVIVGRTRVCSERIRSVEGKKKGGKWGKKRRYANSEGV